MFMLMHFLFLEVLIGLKVILHVRNFNGLNKNSVNLTPGSHRVNIN